VINALKAFAAGFLATVFGHQPMMWLLGQIGFVSFPAWSMKPVPPLGVPSFISLAFWGGVWGIILLLIIQRQRGARYWVIAALVGAIAPTLVAGLIIAPLRGQQLKGDKASLLVMGLLVNLAWALGTALLIKLFRARPIDA
jgi:hypothetical protein